MAVAPRVLEAPALPRAGRLARAREWWEQEHVFGYGLILPDMVAKAVNGMPTKRAMAWAEDQVKLAAQGKLKEAGS